MAKKSTSDFPSKVSEVKSMVTRTLPVLKSGTDAAYPAYALEKSARYTYAFHSLYKTKDIEKDNL